jgi:sulfatase maturation enzyme AslB (radical SAM superfamily)
MVPSNKLAIDVTWRCNWTCKHCFYRRDGRYHGQTDAPIEAVKDRIDRGYRGGLRHVVFIGQGEPSLCSNTPALLDYARSLGMSTSIITNGATGPDRFIRYFRENNLDHLHISTHGLGKTLEEINGVPGSFAKQVELKRWLKAQGLPYRSNTTLQKDNYKQLTEIAEHEAALGVKHFAFLGFLPHYEWRTRAAEVAVHPAELRPHIEAAARRLTSLGVLFTIRYQPLCHLDADLWPHVVNAGHATFCPWEWSYTIDFCEQPNPGQLMEMALVMETARRMEDSVGILGKPCNECIAAKHCCRWNRFYADNFGGAGLTPIREVPDQYRNVWDAEYGLHDLNPANHCTGTIGR